MLCRDCGEEIKKASKRSDVCQDCFEKRGKILKLVESKKLEWDKFQYIQACMQKGNGTAVFFMNDVLDIENPPTEEGNSEDMDDFFNNIEF